MLIKIKMFSDYICPFCYLGKAIIDNLKNQYEIELEHVGIEIHPETPPNGVDLKKYFSQTNQAVNEMYENLKCRGKQYSLNFCDLQILSNSKKSLIIGEYAKILGKNEQYTNAIFKAYFEDCQDISKEEVIVAVAEKIGLIKAQVEVALADPLLQERYEKNCSQAKEQNVTGVPTFVVNDKYTIVGAQSEQTFMELFEKMQKENSENSPINP